MQYVSLNIPEPDLPHVYRLLLEKDIARAAASTTAPSDASGTSDHTDDGDRNDRLAKVWYAVMPKSRAVIDALIEGDHKSNNPISYPALQEAAQTRSSAAP